MAGSLCSSLCDSSNIVYHKCTNYKRGKRVVFAECTNSCVNGSTIMTVLKSKNDKQDILNLPKDKKGDISEDGQRMARTIFLDTVYNSMHYQIPAGANVFSFLWSLDYSDFIHSSTLTYPVDLAFKSIWSLIQQDEYLFMKLYQKELHYIPRLYGTCGPFYFMEFAPPGKILNPTIFHPSRSSWKDRAKIALGILEIAQSLETHFHEPVHFCDIKEENFGIAEDKSVKILDTDSLFFDEIMMRILQEQKCTSHEDCDFFDCRGWCNKAGGKCVANRTNNNLQVCIFCKIITMFNLVM